jgi:hypothetical protein
MEGTDSRYSVREGDTLAGIAPQVFGDSSLWYMIAEANGLSGAQSLAAGTSLIANHQGQPVAVRAVTKQKQPRGTAVKVASGMGSRVEVGKLPEPPRPLPPPPAFAAPQLTVATFAATSSVRVAWDPLSPSVRSSRSLIGVPPGATRGARRGWPASATKIRTEP